LDTIVARRCLFAIAPDGTEHEIVLAVGAPRLHPGGEWSADVSLGVLPYKPFTVFGVDSWQALELAMRYVALQVEHFTEQGWRFFQEKGGESASR